MRVSTLEQNIERQQIELLRYGIIEKNIFCDKLSGKDFNRPQYKKLKSKLKEGDVLVMRASIAWSETTMTSKRNGVTRNMIRKYKQTEEKEKSKISD